VLVDLEYCTEDQVIECLAKNREYVQAWDQYALNVVLSGQWGSLDGRWNQGWHIYEFPSWEQSPYDRETFKQVTAQQALDLLRRKILKRNKPE
jgi:lipopolysaccharide biosynthesis glycosyltransferase